jgi:hypothetical protein
MTLKIKKMRKLKLVMAIFSLVFMSTLVMSQSAAPKKANEKITAQFELMAKDLQLTPEQTTTGIQLFVEKNKVMTEKMKTATTDDEKKALRKESNLDYNKKVDDTFGKELGDKMRAWQKEFAAKNKPQLPQQPQQPEQPKQ